MAVAPSTHIPQRTCVGCRRSVSATELLRVVVVPDPTGEEHGQQAVSLTVVPDPRRRAAGRGAWVHPDLQCVEIAERRRAFARALRAPGPVDPAPVREYVARAGSTSQTTQIRRSGDTAP